MGFWHTGYMDFHEPTGLDTVYRPSKPSYPCHYCGTAFGSMEELRRHRFQAHPVAQPLLFVRGTELGATAFRVTQPLGSSDIQLDHATKAQLNGVPVRVDEVPRCLAEVQSDRVIVELSNEGTSARFELLVRIARENDLAGVEAAFLTMARAHELTIRAIERFIADCKPFNTAGSYTDGLCHYLYGVLAKEKAPDSGLRYDEYEERYNRAADALKGLDRPLAHMVQALVAFHFNHFEDAQAAPPSRLRNASVLFSGLLEGFPWHLEREPDATPSNALEDLLTDHETLRILRWTKKGRSELGACAKDIAERTKRDIPGFDRFKLLLMLSEARAAQGDADGARQVARELRGNTRAAAWAESLLSRLPPKEFKE